MVAKVMQKHYNEFVLKEVKKMTYKIKVKNLNKLRKNILIQGLTVKEFAKETEINYGYLISILNGKRTPSPKLAKQISQKLNKNVDDIFFI
ncbi:hypothetical protein PI20285_07480 [Pediococcus inopinatus]|nr:hypothetical protein PI20285_07480 [Pediococcus inopinatus]KRN62009.1 hypothetical protein IV83_GL000426 [Pediococcus inopinatus]